MRSKINHLILTSFFILGYFLSANAADLLTQEESLWLKSRNNTIIFLPQKNNPPFSYQSSSTFNQGLAVDFINLIAEKVDAKIEYLPSRFLPQLLDEAKDGKGDVVSLSITEDRSENFYFTDSYITIPAVVVVRNDYKKKSATLNEFSGMKVAIKEDSAVYEFVRENFPTVIIEGMTDDEISLQQLILGEVNAVVMDVASLSYYLSKQVLNSVRVVGNVGFDYTPAFAVSKDDKILQSILDKGLSQISKSDRQLLIDKWVNLNAADKKLFADSEKVFGGNFLYNIIFAILIGIVFVLIIKRHHFGNRFSYSRKKRLNEDLQEEISELNYASKAIAHELEDIKNLEKDIQEKIKKLD